MENTETDRRERYAAAIRESYRNDGMGAISKWADATMAVADEEQRGRFDSLERTATWCREKVRAENESLRGVINERSRQLQEADETARRLRTELTQVTEHRDLILRWNVDTAATAERDEVEIDSLRAEIARLRTELAEERRKH